jgi:hypothetical protein
MAAIFTTANNYAASTSSSASTSATFGNNNVPGHLLVAFVLTVASTIGNIAVTDNAGNIWVQAGSWFNYSGSNYVGVFYVLSAKNSSKAAVSIGGVGQTFGSIVIGEYSYTSGFTAALDATGHAQAFNNNVSYTVAANFNDDLIFGGVFSNAGGTTLTAGGSFTAAVQPGSEIGLLDWADAGAAGTVSVLGTLGGGNQWTGFGASFTATAPAPPSNAYSVPDCRLSPFGPNASRSVQGTLIYDKQTSSNSTIPGVDSRVQGAPVDCRISPNIPQNSRAPGTYGPGE